MTTKHTCGGPVFGTRTPGCPRCEELAAGAAPVQRRNMRRESEAALIAAIRNHNCRISRCGPVCTFGDW